MATRTTFDYESFIRQNLEPHPPGRTSEELEAAIPSDADVEALHTALDDSEAVTQIGETWRWMKF